MKQAIEKIMSEITDECVITSCGYISREVYRANDRDRNFYCLGAMGNSIGLALGLAYQRPDLKVVVISGDGAVLMSLGTMVLQGHLKLKNLYHYILNNKCYASTGGQNTCFNDLNILLLSTNTKIISTGKTSNAPRIPLKCSEIRRRFVESICIRD